MDRIILGTSNGCYLPEYYRNLINDVIIIEISVFRWVNFQREKRVSFEREFSYTLDFF